MSLVSAFAAIPQDTTPTRPQVTEPGQAATSFAQLLDDPKDGNKKEAEKTPQHPAYSFAELGMFGLHAGRPSDTATAKDNDAKSSTAKTLAHLSADNGSSTLAPAQAVIPLISVPYIDGEILTVVSRVGAVQTAGAITPSTVASTPAPAKPASAAKAGNARPSSTPSMQNPAKSFAAQAAKPVADKVSVVVSGPGEALQVAVRAPEEAVTEVAKLRRLIESTVAHFEMDMAELHFNGTSLDTAFSLGGGGDGGSAG